MICEDLEDLFQLNDDLGGFLSHSWGVQRGAGGDFLILSEAKASTLLPILKNPQESSRKAANWAGINH